MQNRLFGNIYDPGQWVYHYTSREIALEKVLPSGKIMMSPFSAVNDPRESKGWLFSLSCPSGRLPEDEEFFRMQDTATAYVKGRCKVLCTVQDDPRVVADGLDAPFHRGYARPRMWAQYSYKHSGVCLILERSKLHAAIEKKFGDRGALYSGAVRYYNVGIGDGFAFDLDYEEILTTSLELALDKKIEKHHRAYFFSKAEDWSNEIEWRWVLRGNDTNPEFVPIDDALAGIVLGNDWPSVYDPAIVPFGKKYRVHIARMMWRNGHPSVLAGPYDPNSEH